MRESQAAITVWDRYTPSPAWLSAYTSTNIMDRTEYDEHRCRQCQKSYSRRDLLMRHRRRCQPTKVVSKRKACTACVKAKIKCSYTQPSCLHCTKRKVNCEYTVQVDKTSDTNYTNTVDIMENGNTDSTNINHNDGGATAETTAALLGNTNAFSLKNNTSTLAYMDIGDGMTELASDFQWTAAMSPSTLEAFSGTMHSTQNISIQSLSSIMSPANTGFAELGITNPASLPAASLSQHLPVLFNIPDDLPIDTTILSILMQYPKMLLNEDYRSPFLHRELYSGITPDMTSLVRTSTAICCSAALECKSSRSYIQRAIEQNRNNLIQTFPKYTCMEQWDALHAMWIYEILELESLQASKTDSWRPGYRAKGIKIPLLIKMTRCFCEAHPEIVSALGYTTSTSDSLPRPKQPLSWELWVVAETAQRTIFLANLVNFFANRDLTSRRQSPYYDPLENDLVLNMPLPCSHGLWHARSEEQWMEARRSEEMRKYTQYNFATEPFNTGQPTLQTLLANNSKEQLRVTFAASYGIADSDSLRGLIVLAALEQFT